MNSRSKVQRNACPQHRLLTALLACAAFSCNAWAANDILCSITTSALAFGNYDPSFAAPTDGTGTITITCTDTNTSGGSTQRVDAALALSAGSYGTVAARKMQVAGGNDQLAYNIYRDSARTQIWGDGSSYPAQTLTINNIPRRGTRSASATVYARISGQQNIRAGDYVDYLTLTVTP